MTIWRRLNALIRGDELDRGLNAEMRFHIEMETEKNIKLGMSPDDTRTRALRSFGPMEKHKEETRDARGVSWFETLRVWFCCRAGGVPATSSVLRVFVSRPMRGSCCSTPGLCSK